MNIDATTPVLIHVLSLDTVGGVEVLYVNYLADALSRAKAVHFTSVCGKPPQEFFAKRFASMGHTPFLEEHVWGMRLPRFLRSVVRICRSLVEGIVNPNAWVFWNRIESRPPPGKAIYYEHGGAWNVAPTKARREFLASCERVIANSEAAAVILKERWGVSQPIRVVPNPLRPDLPVAAAARPALSGPTVRLGCIGRLVPVKGFEVAIHALPILRGRGIDATLSIAGAGPLERAARALADRLGIADALIWNGRQADVAPWYDSIDILLVPSIREPLGLVALEAAARAVPVIAASVDGLPEAVLDGRTGICLTPTLSISEARGMLSDVSGLPDVVVDPVSRQLRAPLIVDPCAYADAIELLINDADRYTQYSANAVVHARNRSDFASYSTALSEEFERSP